MKKKILLLLSLVCFIMPCAFMFSACDSGKEPPVMHKEPPVMHMVRFFNHDGSLINEIEVEENSAALCETPTKESSQYYVYEFDKWVFIDGSDATNSLESVSKDLDVKATFVERQPTYTINFYDEDGVTLLDTKTVLRGESLTLSTDLTKEADEYFYYSFAKWEDANNQSCTEITMADKNMDFYITWDAVRHSALINFYDEDKTTLLKTVVKKVGSHFEPSQEYKAVKKDWTFLNWYDENNQICGYIYSFSNELNLYAYYAKNIVVENGITYKLDVLQPEDIRCYAIESSDNALVSAELDLDKTFYTLRVLKILNKAFLNNSNITKVKIRNIPWIQYGAFYNCPNIVFDTEGNTEYKWYGGDYQCLINYGSDGNVAVTYANNAMKTLPNEINYISPYAFTSCSFEEIVLGENVEIMHDDSFYDCKNLKKITIGKNLYKIWGGFMNIDIVEDMTEVEIVISDENNNFGVLEWYDTDKTTLLKREIYEKYYGISYYQAEKAGYSVAGWNDDEGNPYEILLSGKINTSNLSLVKFYASTEWLPNCTQGLISYKYSAASGGYEVVNVDKSCIEVIIPSEINGYPVTGIASNAFKDNKSLTSITISNSVKIIRTNAFEGCTGIKNIVIPSSVTTIEYNAFDYNCRFDSITIDSATIANNLITNSSTNCWITDAVKVYIKTGLDVSKSTYLYEKCTKQETSDKAGYDMYVRN